MNKTIENIETLKELLDTVDVLLRTQNLNPSIEGSLVRLFKKFKKDLRDLRAGKPIEGLKG